MTTDGFKAAIKGFLDAHAQKEPDFQKHLENPKKNLKDCTNYILNQVQKSGCNGFEDEEIFKMAIRYYSIENIHVGKDISSTVFVNHSDIENPKYKAYKINTQEIDFVAKSLESETNSEMRNNWEEDLKNLHKNPKKYWDSYSTENLEDERKKEVEFMIDFYKKEVVKPYKPRSAEKPKKNSKPTTGLFSQDIPKGNKRATNGKKESIKKASEKINQNTGQVSLF